MPELRLLPVSQEHAGEIYACMQDIPSENGFTNEDCGCTVAQYVHTAIPRMQRWSRSEGLPEGYVPETFFILWDGAQAVGMFRLRHCLTAALREGAGHIGYAIRRSERGKGYAVKGLALTVEAARRVIPEDEIYLRVWRSNPASLKVMLKCGAYIHHEDDRYVYTRIPLRKEPER